jgi:AraC-like DNA-binding protein
MPAHAATPPAQTPPCRSRQARRRRQARSRHQAVNLVQLGRRFLSTKRLALRFGPAPAGSGVFDAAVYASRRLHGVQQSVALQFLPAIIPPPRYLLTRPLEQAEALLRDAHLAITAIAFETGWNSLGTFACTCELRARQQAALHRIERVPTCHFSAAYRPDLTIAVSEKWRQDAVVRVGS